MSDKNFKAIRKQLRNVVQEILPELMQKEVITAIEKKLAENLHARLNTVAEQCKATLDTIDQRSKDVQDYLIRNNVMATAPKPVPSEVTPPAKQ